VTVSYYTSRAFANRVSIAVRTLTGRAPVQTARAGMHGILTTTVTGPELDAICLLLGDGVAANRITREQVAQAMGRQS
jgi:hypothetical protein